jgi:ribonuclease-3
MDEALSGYFVEDYKTSLQELLQRDGNKNLRYQVISEEGPDHAKIFTTAVYSDQIHIGMGRGTNKKEAEQDAARDALINIHSKR